jgi:hypothetical protein
MIYGWDIIDEKTQEEMKKFPIGLYSKNAETDEKFMEHLYGLDYKFDGLAISPLSRSKILIWLYGLDYLTVAWRFGVCKFGLRRIISCFTEFDGCSIYQ